MKTSNLRSLALGALIGGLTAALVTSTVIYAHGGGGSLIHGCINLNGGLRITAAPGYGNPSTVCAGGETSVDWSQTGPAGPPGAPGPAGPAGSARQVLLRPVPRLAPRLPRPTSSVRWARRECRTSG